MSDANATQIRRLLRAQGKGPTVEALVQLAEEEGVLAELTRTLAQSSLSHAELKRARKLAEALDSATFHGRQFKLNNWTAFTPAPHADGLAAWLEDLLA